MLAYTVIGFLTSFGILLLWLVLLVLLIMVACRRVIKWPAAVLAIALVLLSFYAAIEAQQLLMMPADQPILPASAPPWPLPPFRWPLIVPALIPSLVIGFGLWATTPRLRVRVPIRLAFGLTWSLVLVLTLAIFPMKEMQTKARFDFYTLWDQRSRAVLSMPADSPLWDWVKFLDVNSAAVTSSVKRLARRQSDAEIMLDRGDFPLAYLGDLDLDPTSTICDKARGLIQRNVAARRTKLTAANPYSRDIEDEIDGEAWAMQWLASHGCDVSGERDSVISLALAYQYSPLQSVAIDILKRIPANP